MATVARLDNFGFLAVTGKDAQKFLQGYVTCDMDDVTPDKSAIGAICNLQGRMVTSFRIAATDDGYLLRMARELVPATMEFLQKYIVFSKAEMDDRSDTVHCFACTGAITGFPEGRYDAAPLDGGLVVRVSGENRFEVWTVQPDWLPQEGEPMEPAAWRSWEIEAGIAWVTSATSEQFIPQMLAYHTLGGVAFDKGCYLGQEIVARMQYRGALTRHLYRGKSGGPLEINDPLQDATGKTVGQVVAAEDDTFLAVIQVKNDRVPDVPGCSIDAVA